MNVSIFAFVGYNFIKKKIIKIKEKFNHEGYECYLSTMIHAKNEKKILCNI